MRRVRGQLSASSAGATSASSRAARSEAPRKVEHRRRAARPRTSARTTSKSAMRAWGSQPGSGSSAGSLKLQISRSPSSETRIDVHGERAPGTRRAPLTSTPSRARSAEDALAEQVVGDAAPVRRDAAQPGDRNRRVRGHSAPTFAQRLRHHLDRPGRDRGNTIDQVVGSMAQAKDPGRARGSDGTGSGTRDSKRPLILHGSRRCSTWNNASFSGTRDVSRGTSPDDDLA